MWCWRRLLSVRVSLRQQGDPISQSLRKSTLNTHWKAWSWSSNTLATWWEEPPHWKRLWCWERLRTKEEGDDRGWNEWMASSTQWTWIWANSGRQWRIGRAAVHGVTKSQTWLSDWTTTYKKIKKYGNSDTSYNMDDPWIHCANWK